MNWEEYMNTDAYRESHPNWDYRPSIEEQKEDLMRSYINDVDEHDNWLREHQMIKLDNGEAIDQIEDGEVEVTDDGDIRRVMYVCAKTWNGHLTGLLCVGTYKECRMKMYEYDLACLRSDYDWACVLRETYETDEERDAIIDSYRELACESVLDYDYDEY